MSNRTAAAVRATKKAPIVRLPPKSNLELLLARGSQAAVLLIGLVVVIAALSAAEYILVPISLGVVGQLIRKLNDAMAGEYEIRGFRHTLEDDTHCFYVQSCRWWRAMEEHFPKEIKRVFAKTGVSRQSELAGLITRLVLR